MDARTEVSGGSSRRLSGPEVLERARRRSHSAEYKLQVLQQADACKNSGEIGALLRREGLYSSHLASWRRQRREGSLQALSNRRGRKSKSPEQLEAEKLRRENAQLRRRLERAEFLIEIQKKASEILGMKLPEIPSDDEDESD
jgi:transposase